MNWLRKMMMGRYGSDHFNLFLLFFYLVMATVTLFTRYDVFIWIGYGAVGFSLFRMFSKNRYRRQMENQLFLKATKPMVSWFVRQKNRIKYAKTHKYFDCPTCKMHLRAPRHKGSITVTCPACKGTFQKRT